MSQPNYLLTENLTSTICVYLILKKLMLSFDQWDAYKLKIIDKDGKKLKHPVTSKERESWDMLSRFCWNIKKITSKFIGKGSLAHNFTAAYLLKDSLDYYVKSNSTKLNETLLSDMTYTKQNIIYNALKDISEHNNLAITTQDNLELEIYKQLNNIEETLKQHPEFVNLFEDGEVISGSVGTVAGDIAQLTPPLGATIKRTKLVDPILKRKKKRKIKNESN